MSANSFDINAPNSAAHGLQSTAVFNTYSNTSTVNTDQSRYTVELHDQLFALLLDALSEMHMHVCVCVVADAALHCKMLF